MEQLQKTALWVAKSVVFVLRQWLNLVLVLIPYRNPGIWTIFSLPICIYLLYKAHYEVWCYLFGDCGMLKTIGEVISTMGAGVNMVIVAYNRFVGILNTEAKDAPGKDTNYKFSSIPLINTTASEDYSISGISGKIFGYWNTPTNTTNSTS